MVHAPGIGGETARPYIRATREFRRIVAKIHNNATLHLWSTDLRQIHDALVRNREQRTKKAKIVAMHDYISGLSTSAVVDEDLSRSGRKTRSALLRVEKARQTGSLGFRSGTRVLTTTGACPVEELSVGQKVHTRDHGIQPITWTGATGGISGSARTFLTASAGAVGQNEAICLAPRQTVLISNWQDDTQSDRFEALVEIRGLDSLDGIKRTKQANEACYHLMLPHHALIMANGLWCDSLHPEDATSQSVGADALSSLSSLLKNSKQEYGPKILPVISGAEARAILRG